MAMVIPKIDLEDEMVMPYEQRQLTYTSPNFRDTREELTLSDVVDLIGEQYEGEWGGEQALKDKIVGYNNDRKIALDKHQWIYAAEHDHNRPSPTKEAFEQAVNDQKARLIPLKKLNLAIEHQRHIREHILQRLHQWLGRGQLTAILYNVCGDLKEIPTKVWRTNEWENFILGHEKTDKYDRKYRGHLGSVSYIDGGYYTDFKNMKGFQTITQSGVVLFRKSALMELIENDMDHPSNSGIKDKLDAKLKQKAFDLKPLAEQQIEGIISCLTSIASRYVAHEVVPSSKLEISDDILDAVKDSKKYSKSFEKAGNTVVEKLLPKACQKMGFDSWDDYRDKEIIAKIGQKSEIPE